MYSPPSPSPSYTAKQKPVEQEIKESTISKIEISEADLDKLKRLLQSDHACPWTKESKQRKIVGICSGCGDIPEFLLTKYYEGAVLIEKYCTKCIGSIQTTIEK